MSDQPKHGGPVHPTAGHVVTGTGADFEAGSPYQWMEGVSPGMSLRDYFAAAALPSAKNVVDTLLQNGDANPKPIPQWIAETAYELADAMLSERNK